MMNGIDYVAGVLLKGPQTFTGIYSCRDIVSVTGRKLERCTI